MYHDHHLNLSTTILLGIVIYINLTNTIVPEIFGGISLSNSKKCSKLTNTDIKILLPNIGTCHNLNSN